MNDLPQWCRDGYGIHAAEFRRLGVMIRDAMEARDHDTVDILLEEFLSMLAELKAHNALALAVVKS